jgi:L-asparagine permease
MPWAPVTSWLTLGFLASVLVLMAFDYPNGTFTISTIPIIILLLVLGWYGLRNRAKEVQAAQVAHEEAHHASEENK